LDLYKDMHGAPPPRADLVLNQCDGEPAGPASVPFHQVLRVPQDPRIAELDSAGASLLGLGPASPAVAALASWEVRG
jgi:hypothetical protein